MVPEQIEAWRLPGNKLEALLIEAKYDLPTQFIVMRVPFYHLIN